MASSQIVGAEFSGHTVPNAAARSKPIIEVDFCKTSDGSLLELVEDPKRPGCHRLCVFRNREVRYVKSYEQENQIFVPLQLTGKLWQHVIFPKEAGKLDSLKDIVIGIQQFILCTLELEHLDRWLVAYFILSTWFIDQLPVAPYLAFVGPPGSGKTRALQVLNLLCRRSLLTADISSAAFHKLCDRIYPTLLIDETSTLKNKHELMHLLRSGFTNGLVSLHAKGASKMFGAKVMSWLELPDDAALNSRCLIIPMKTSVRRDLFSLDDPRIQQSSYALRRALLRLRLERYNNLSVPELFGQFTLQPRTRDLYRALSIPLRGEPFFRELLLEKLKQQESIRATLPRHQSAVLEVVFDLAHAKEKYNNWRISYLTEAVNARLRDKGEGCRLSEKRLGSVLTTFHFTDRTRTNTGYVLWIGKDTLQQIHTLFFTYRSSLDCSSFEGCELCDRVSATPGNPSKSKSKKKDTPQGDRYIT